MVLNCHQQCNGVQRHDNTSYIWDCYQIITNHKIYVCRGITSTVYFICKSRPNKAGLTLGDTRSSRRQRPMDKKVTKMRQSKQWKEGSHEEPVEYGVFITSLNRQHSVAPAQCLLNVSIMHFFCKIT